MRIITWNINSIRQRINHLLLLIKNCNPDIICLQETKCTESSFPHHLFECTPYNVIIRGQKSHNGVAIFSKIKPENIEYSFSEDSAARFLEIDVLSLGKMFKIISLYVPNGGNDRMDYKLGFLQSFHSYILEKRSENIIIGGDFNIAPYEIDSYYSDCIGCTIEEREEIYKFYNMGFYDPYRRFYNSNNYTWWDYRGGSFFKNQGMRIDYFLTNIETKDCRIYKDFRKLEKPSDHVPVILDLA